MIQCNISIKSTLRKIMANSVYTLLAVYYILGIIFLVRDYDEYDECHDSTLWLYVLVSLIVFINKYNMRNLNKNKHKICSAINLLIDLIMGIWGAVDLFDLSYNCSIKYSGLWAFGVVCMCQQFLTPFLIAYLFYSHKNQNKSEEEKNIDEVDSNNYADNIDFVSSESDSSLVKTANCQVSDV